MIKSQRQAEIVRLLEENDTMLISILADTLGCSMMTIRRDVDELSQASIVKKVHGGVSLYKTDILQPSFERRILEHTAEKERIGAAAAKMITDGCSVMFDAGTTPLHVIRAIPASVTFTAICTSVRMAIELCSKPNVTVITLGGEIHHSSFSAVNSIAIDTANQFKTDLAIISAKAIELPYGLYENSLPLIEIKKTIIRQAERVVLVADSSKFSEHAMCQSVSFDSIHTVVTDTGLDEATANGVRKLGKDLALV